MLDSLKWLGERLTRSRTEKLLQVMVKPLRRKMANAHLLKIIFDVDEKKVRVESEQLTGGALKEYLWIGNTFAAAREPIARLTTDNLKYIIDRKNNLISNTRKAAQDRSGESDAIAELEHRLALIEETFVKDGDIARLVSEAIGDKRKQAGLYTVCLSHGGKDIALATTEGYKELLMKLLTVPDPKRLRMGICHVCGMKKSVLTDPAFEAGSLPKIYVRDKKSFASGIFDSDEAWVKNFAICPDCRQHIILAWFYIREIMVSTDITGINAYLIPRFEGRVPVKDIDKLASFLKDSYKRVACRLVAGFDHIMNFDEQLRGYAEDKGQYSVTIVFGSREQASFNVHMVIQDVPVTRFHFLRNKIDDLANFAVNFFGGDKKVWILNFSNIYGIFPLAVERGKPKNPRPFLELLDSMLSLHSYRQDQLIFHAVQFARIQRYRSYAGFNIRKPRKNLEDSEMCIGLLKYILLTSLLEEINVLEEERKKLELSANLQTYLPEDIKEWLRRMGYTELQQALFLLGYLVGEVGTAQYHKGDEKKSILDKVDFHGMSKEKVIELSVEILNSLRNYRILNSRNETVYYCMKALLDKNIHELRRNPLENVYYLLSGYAFITCKNIFRGDMVGYGEANQ